MVINKVSNKNKIIVSIIIMLMMLIIMSVSSLAWVGYPETGYEDTHQMFIAEEKTTGDIFAIRKKEEGFNTNKSWFTILTFSSDKQVRSYYDTSYTGQIFKKHKWLPNLQEWGEEQEVNEIYIKSILQSNIDIYSNYDKTSVFFSPPITLTRVLDQHPPLSLMSPQIVGLLPYLIGLLIVSVGFWKAWQFLSKTLQKA